MMVWQTLNPCLIVLADAIQIVADRMTTVGHIVPLEFCYCCVNIYGWQVEHPL